MYIELSDFRIKYIIKSFDENIGKIIIFYFSNLKKLIVCLLKFLEKNSFGKYKERDFLI